ncbi:DUF6913 domain-containing protein [Flavobacterium sp.]|uniref:DUF6913 domain-containing protein n=1 Tax=Flavobacterium sp. TaxID=239 RepID=UPI003751E899
MFWNKIKDFSVKKIVKKKLLNVNHLASNNSIKNVGILFDETYFYEKEKLINELVKNGIEEQNITFLVFKNTIKKNDVFNFPIFSHKDLSWTATFEKKEVVQFINKDIDLLLSYYDTEKAALMLVTHLSKASFKVGFASVDKRLNHFMIDTNAENYKVFTYELFKYLKILNKL